MNKLEAPFDNDAAQRLNEAQTHTGRGFPCHPFTCANRNDGCHGTEGGDLGVLIATETGWVCPHCDYRQNWTHAGMIARTEQVGATGRLSSFFAPNLERNLTARIEAYLPLADGGRAGAVVMLECLQRRRKEFESEGH